MGCTVIRESDVATIERLGKFDRIIKSGCHYYNCCLESVGNTRSLQLQTQSLSVETITKEQLSVTIKVGIQCKINEHSDCSDYNDRNDRIELSEKIDENSAILGSKNYGTGSYQKSIIINPQLDPIYLAIYRTSNPMQQIAQLVHTYFRSISCNFTLEQLMLSKNSLSNDLAIILNKEMIKYGYYIHNVLILDIDPPDNIKQSMNSVHASKNKRDAMINEAEAEKKAAILKAEGLSEVRRLEGIGLANQRKALTDGLKTSIGEFCNGQKLDPRELTSTIITMQYLDMLHSASANGKNTFILSSNPTAANSIEDQVRNALLSVKMSDQV